MAIKKKGKCWLQHLRSQKNLWGNNSLLLGSTFKRTNLYLVYSLKGYSTFYGNRLILQLSQS